MHDAPNILLLSAYAAQSHRAWADWLTGFFSAYAWQRLELPGRHFRWRIRGNPLSWLDSLPAEPPDLLIATSMVDLATLRGLHPRLASAPTWYYFHENQFAYPVSSAQVRSIEPQIVQIYSALCCERLVFNSAFNRDSFLDGLDALLKRMPDQVPRAVRARLEPRCEILPVPIDPVPAGSVRDERLILWGHRWEYDKDPDRFADAILALAARGQTFRLALLGERPDPAPMALQRLRSELGDRIVADTYPDKATYRAWLARAAIAVSTTRHEFQGLAMLEAASAGATPLVPDALCYPEQYPPACRYPAGDTSALTHTLASWLEEGRPPPVDVSAWSERALGPIWLECLQRDTADTTTPAD